MVFGQDIYFQYCASLQHHLLPIVESLRDRNEMLEKHFHAKIRAFQCARYFEEKNLNFGVDLLQSCKKILVYFTINVTVIFSSGPMDNILKNYY